MLKKFFCGAALAAGCVTTLFAEFEPIVWKFPAATAEWTDVFNATIEEGEDSINLIPRKPDHGIINYKTAIDPAYNCIRITYKAEGFKVAHTSGEIFFNTDGSRRFSPARSVKMPSLQADGVVRVAVAQINHPQWKAADKITALRLDVTDQYPGDVHIYKVELLRRDAFIENAVWDFSNGAGCWDVPDRMNISEENGELKLDITGRDSHLFNTFNKFDGSKYTKLKITYRATGFKRTTGGIFFRSKGMKNFNQKSFFSFPSLICDGKEHSFTVKVKLPKEIIALRLDIVDQAPGTVYLKKIEFLP